MAGFIDWLKSYGALLLVLLTLLQGVFFVAYSTFYVIIFKKYNPDAELTRTELY